MVKTDEECRAELEKLRVQFVAERSIAGRHAILNTAISDPDLKDCKTLQR